MASMEMSYIIFRKNVINKGNDKGGNDATIDSMIKSTFENVNVDSFTIPFNNNNITLNYQIHCINNENNKVENLCLCIEDNSKERCAKILERANSLLINQSSKNIMRENFHIITAEDNISKYYCGRIYPYIDTFERKLRKIVFWILTSLFKENWYKQPNVTSKDKDMQKKLKANYSPIGGDIVVEAALYAVTLGDLIDFLFKPFPDNDLSLILNNELAKDKIKELSREEILSALDSCRGESIWERYFNHIKINDLELELKKISEYRNNVAHSKFFYSKDYNVCKKSIEKLLPEMEKACTFIQSGKIDYTRFRKELLHISSILATVALQPEILQGIKAASASLAQIGGIYTKALKYTSGAQITQLNNNIRRTLATPSNISYTKLKLNKAFLDAADLQVKLSGIRSIENKFNSLNISKTYPQILEQRNQLADLLNRNNNLSIGKENK